MFAISLIICSKDVRMVRNVMAFSSLDSTKSFFSMFEPISSNWLLLEPMIFQHLNYGHSVVRTLDGKFPCKRFWAEIFFLPL